MKVLCVAEKPSISKSITQILSGGQFSTRPSRNKYIKNYDFAYRLPPPLGGHGDADFTVTAVLGHSTDSDFDNDHRKWSSCDPFASFDARIVTQVSSNLRDVERNLQAEARNADLLMIWTDCDREGEHIGSEVAEVCKRANRRLVVKRARFSAIIAAQIHQACRNADDSDMRQAAAVETRIALDSRIGAAFTRLTTLGIQPHIPDVADQVISYGPCQFPTLGFVVDQWNKMQSFVPEPFWYIYVAIEREDEADPEKVETVDFKWRRNHSFDMPCAVVSYEQCVQNPMATVISVETKPTTKWKPLPLTTVELQQSGSRLLHMAPKRVSDLAEKSYQKGFLSYPRTETDQYDKAFDFQSSIQKQTNDREWGAFAQRLAQGEFERPRNGRKNDKAHPPIHPTAAANNLDPDERKVFESVTRRFLASCHSNAEGKTTTIEIEIADERFFTTGLVVMRRNYLEVYPYDKWSSSILPDFQEGETFMPTVCELRDGTTTRPSLLTEADLVGLMDKNGIGTDATIAEHIAKIIERKYVIEKPEGKSKYSVPSPLGIGSVEGYNQIGFDRSLSKPHSRAETEHRMQLICDGRSNKVEVLDATIEEYKEVYMKAKRDFATVLESVRNFMHGQGVAQEAVRAAARGGRGGRGTRGARGGRGGGGRAPARRNDNDEDDDGEDDDDSGPPRGGGAVRRGAASSRARGTTTRGRGRGRGASTADAGPSTARRPPDLDDGLGGTPTCSCDLPAKSLTVNKSGPNHGRKFWGCAKPQGEGCGFFEWDQGQSEAGPSRPTATRRAPATSRSAPPEREAPRKRPRSESEDEEGTVRCECQSEAKLAVVNKSGPNQGRQFWACPNNYKAQCGFFEWADDEPRPAPERPTNRSRGTSRSTRGATRGGGGRSRAKTQNRGNGDGGGGCFRCGEDGHWASACPNEDRSGANTSSSRGAGPSGRGGGRNGGGAGASDECYKCGRKGHWASACPE